MKYGIQREISKKAGVNYTCLNNYINGSVPCPPRNAIKLEAVTGVDRALWVFPNSPETGALLAILEEKYPTGAGTIELRPLVEKSLLAGSPP